MNLIIDCNNICYKSFFTTGGLKYEEEDIGIIFGFMSELLFLAKKFEARDFIFCWDSKKSYRKLIYPEYKVNRKDKSPEELKSLSIAYRQFDLLRKEILPYLGFNNNFIQAGYEADDLMAYISKQLSDKDKYNIIVSSDNDMLQCMNKFTTIWNGKNRATPDSFIEESKTSHYNWIDVKARAGCSSDNVKGIEGVGELTATKYMRGMIGKGKIFDRIESKEGREIIKRNRKLIELPYKGLKLINIELKKDKLNEEKFYTLFMKYGFRSFLEKERFKEWIDKIIVAF